MHNTWADWTSTREKLMTRQGDTLRRHIYVFIVRYIQSVGFPPTVREIAEGLHLTSSGHIVYHLSQLEQRGVLSSVRQRGTSRRIRLYTQLPVPILGTIGSQGITDSFSGWENAPETLYALHAEPSYALQVHDSSMLASHFCKGDYLIIKSHSLSQTGEMVVALHCRGNKMGWDTEIGRFSLNEEQDHICLSPIHDAHPTLFIKKDTWDREWHVLGEVDSILRLFVVQVA